MFKHQLGKLAKDRVTDFTGIITSRTEYFLGGNRYGISPKIQEKDSKEKTEWFDEDRLVIIGEGA